MALIDRNTFDILEHYEISGSEGDFFDCDEELAGTVSLLNKKGYRTRFCCAGHLYDDLTDTFSLEEGEMTDEEIREQIPGVQEIRPLPEGGKKLILRQSVSLRTYIWFERGTFLPSLPEGFRRQGDELSYNYYWDSGLGARESTRGLQAEPFRFYKSRLQVLSELFDWAEKLPPASRAEHKFLSGKENEMKPEMIEIEHAPGRILTFEMEMPTFSDGRTRTIRVWLPDDYDGVKRYPVVYMHDGQNVYSSKHARNTLNLDIALTELKKEGIHAIGVAVDTAPTRGSELTPPYPRRTSGPAENGIRIPLIPEPSTTPQYAEFVVKYVKPLIDENFMTLPDPMNTVVGGISAGGSASFYMMLTYPEVFGRAIVCSPGFPMFSKEALLDVLDACDFGKLKDHRIAFYNGDQGLDGTSLDYVLMVYRRMREKGMDSLHNMYILDTRQTHCEGAWAKYLPEILRFLMLPDNSQPVPEG